jgi:hypothetical protein
MAGAPCRAGAIDGIWMRIAARDGACTRRARRAPRGELRSRRDRSKTTRSSPRGWRYPAPMRLATVSCSTFLLLASGCAGKATSDVLTILDGGSDHQSAMLACSWPATLQPTDPPAGQCAANRLLLQCFYTNGEMAVCVSNDPTQCVAQDSSGDASFTCRSQCELAEYGVVCVGDPLTLQGAPPSTACRSMDVNPAGRGYYCCPCAP